jgi:acyl-CoA hydrolase
MTSENPPMISRFLKKHFGLWLAVLILMSALAACSGKKYEAIPVGARVLVIGDSITAGYGLSPEQAWTTTLAAETGWQVINAGVSGDTTAGGSERLPALLDEHQPLAVIVELGGNDMLRRQSPTSIVANLETMIGEIHRRGSRPILMAVPRPNIAGVVFSSLSDAPFYAVMAREKNIPVIEDILSDTLSKPELKLDELHPNSEGHRQIGKGVAGTLRKLGLVR